MSGEGEGQTPKPSSTPHTVQIILSHMAKEQEKDAIEVALQAFDKHKMNKDISTFIKKEYEKKYPPSGKATDGVYHVVVGSNFGASLSHETKSYLHVKVDNSHVIIFKDRPVKAFEEKL